MCIHVHCCSRYSNGQFFAIGITCHDMQVNELLIQRTEPWPDLRAFSFFRGRGVAHLMLIQSRKGLFNSVERLFKNLRATSHPSPCLSPEIFSRYRKSTMESATAASSLDASRCQQKKILMGPITKFEILRRRHHKTSVLRKAEDPQ